MSHGAKEQAQFHVMTNNPTKYEHILLNDFREVAFTKCHGQTETITMSFHHGTAWDNKTISIFPCVIKIINYTSLKLIKKRLIK